MAIRVVIAEDHTLVRQGTRRILEQYRDIVVVGEAADGEEALHVVQETRPDIVLMDIAMPGLNGIEATRRIKATCPATAVIGLTAFDEDAYVFALLDAGAAGYLMKTIPAEDLAASLRAVHAGESVLSPAAAAKVLARLRLPKGREPGREEHEILTPRERDVLLLAAHGHANKAIATALSLSPRTVQMHLAHIFEKMGVASRTEAVVAGLREGWFPLDDLM